MLGEISIAQISGLINIQSHGAALGTGLVPLMQQTAKTYGGKIPANINTATLKILPATFGGYPDHKDIAPSAVFAAVYIVLTAIHLFIFLKNWSRGHKFYTSLIFILYGFLNFIGYILRIVWAKEITRIHVGLTSTVMILTSTVLLAGGNILLAQRIFTWRQPRIGESTFFAINMYLIYAMVLATIVVGITAGVVPYLYFLSESHFTMDKRAARAAGCLTIIYSATALGLIILAFLFKPRKESSDFIIYQPWWIESFGITYFVPKGTVEVAKEAFLQGPHHHRKPVRVIASSTHHYATVQELRAANQTEAPKLLHNYSIFIILFTVVLLFISSTFRCVSLFIDKKNYQNAMIFRPLVMYLTHGMIEFFILLLYIITRVDLRFYKPDFVKASELENNGTDSLSESHEKDAEGLAVHDSTPKHQPVVAI